MYKLNLSSQNIFLPLLGYESVFLNLSLSKYPIRSRLWCQSGLLGLVSGDHREWAIFDILVTTQIMILPALFKVVPHCKAMTNVTIIATHDDLFQVQRVYISFQNS